MQRLKRLATMLPAQRRLLLRGLAFVAGIRLGLWVLPLSVVRTKTLRFHGYSKPDSVDGIVWAVQTVSRYIPRATCLTQVLAAQAMLGGSDHQSRIEIGVAKEDGLFMAHAWLWCDGQIVLGGPDVDRYVPLAAWEGNN